VIIDAEFGRENHGSIPATAIEIGLESLDVRTDPQIRFNWGENKKNNNKKNFGFLRNSKL
jgi:hypothetical protein